MKLGTLLKADVRGNIYRHQNNNYVKILRFYHANSFQFKSLNSFYIKIYLRLSVPTFLVIVVGEIF